MATEQMNPETVAAAIQAGIKAQANKTPNLLAAYFKFWHEVGNVQKNAQNPHFKNNYANLEAVMAIIKPAMKDNGLALLQIPGEIVNGNMSLLSTIIHTSGEVWNFRTEIPLGEKAGPQPYGSAMTYGRRYFLLTFGGMCPVDDDGEAASQEVEAIEEPAAEDPTLLISLMTGWKPKTLRGKAAADAFTEMYKARASAAGQETAAAFVKRRGELKNG
jgi:hypothetical protein